MEKVDVVSNVNLNVNNSANQDASQDAHQVTAVDQDKAVANNNNNVVHNNNSVDIIWVVLQLFHNHNHNRAVNYSNPFNYPY